MRGDILSNVIAIPNSVLNKNSVNRLLVEGIYDYHVFEGFVESKLKENIGIMPSTGVNNIPKLLSSTFAVRSIAKRVALLDKDVEGDLVFEKLKIANFEDYVKQYPFDGVFVLENFFDLEEVKKEVKNISKNANDIQIKPNIPILYKKSKFNSKDMPNTYKKVNEFWQNYVLEWFK